ncbi:hypothetical protein BN1051_03294 [Arthrobacter saudimassiliensis]|uniref:Activator of Hsp90 ATPase homolog 1-like protein n=1 Tax=Arthrobacter saudimassiliensis TaxID=1461584 RepID=A0A078MUK2_9MICC|nr:hypothetical protein BN1051_03294 [Arthrobacter saudimassiliensis]
MDSLFSHAPEPEPDDVGRPDVELTRVVPRETGEAATGFLEYIHLWWPPELARFGAGTYLELEDGNLVETGPDGDELVWAAVTAVGPDGEVELEWQFGQAPGRPGHVSIRFEAGGPRPDTADTGGTTVRLRHTDIHAGDDGEVPDFRAFWDEALTHYARFMGAR